MLEINKNYLLDQYYCQFSQICLKPNKIVTISIGFQGFGNSIVRSKPILYYYQQMQMRNMQKLLLNVIR
jgi:hypothetical protein